MASSSALSSSGGIFNCEEKTSRLKEIENLLADSQIWSDQQRSRDLGKERVALDRELSAIFGVQRTLADTGELLELAILEGDSESLNMLEQDMSQLEEQLSKLEFMRMFCNPMDPNSAWLEINAGSGGTEAQDWAEMLLRMYLRWCERRGFSTEICEVSAGEVAGIKSATVHVKGDYAFGWLRTETGVHRLVRKSPFDSGNRRHTSFAAVFAVPEIIDDIEVQINPSDLRVDTYRASGAGGQHVNKTDSAVRITHLPTNTVVQCQNQRSQHQNRDNAMRQLRAKLYELEMKERDKEKKLLEQGKADIGWGSQIRSYVLDDSRIKDLRTGEETANCGGFLDGDLDRFIEASLKAGV